MSFVQSVIDFVKTIWSWFSVVYNFFIRHGFTSNQAINIVLFIIIIVAFIFAMFELFQLVVVPALLLILGFISDLSMTDKKFNQGKKHETFSFNASTLEKTLTVLKSERKYITLLKKTFQQGNILQLGGNQYKVDHFILLKREKLSDWHKVRYFYHLVPVTK